MDGLDAQTEYVLEYQHGGCHWSLNFFAVDDADAEAKVDSLRASLVLKGRLMGQGGTLEAAWQAAAQNACAKVIAPLGSESPPTNPPPRAP